MTNLKTTKRALLSSVIALLVCFTMLLGTTFAWFTDSVTSGVNKIQSGNLDVELYHMNYAEAVDAGSVNGMAIPKDEDGFKVGGDTKLFLNEDGKEMLWEPGATSVENFRIVNEGSLALKYQFKIDFFNATKTPTGKTLADIINISASETKYDESTGHAVGVDGSATLADRKLGDGHVFEGTLLPGEAYNFWVGLQWVSSELDNEYNVKGGLSIDLGVTLVATQLTYEKDNFAGDQYDAGAQYPELETTDIWDGTADTSWYNDTDTEFVLTTAEQFSGLSTLVENGNTFEGKTITLSSDLNLYAEDENGNRIAFNPIGHYKNGQSFNGIFDGQGHTISEMYEQSNLDDKNGGWLYEGEYYGLFAYTRGATIKNVTIADAYISSGKNEAAGVVGNAVDTTFSDITISNTTLIAYNNSAGGVAAECYGNCSFTNITVDADTVIGPLWGTYDVRLGGVVGMVETGNNVTFSNITVACQLDAINDVTANYQYWLYRYSGMLIGTVDGVNGVADPTGYVTCENVTVIYGDWVNYHYCEDADLGAGSYNGPGEYKYARVEAGTGTDGIDLSACNHQDDESHNVLIVFDQLFGGGQGVSGLKAYDGVTVTYPNE